MTTRRQRSIFKKFFCQTLKLETILSEKGSSMLEGFSKMIKSGMILLYSRWYVISIRFCEIWKTSSALSWLAGLDRSLWNFATTFCLKNTHTHIIDPVPMVHWSRQIISYANVINMIPQRKYWLLVGKVVAGESLQYFTGGVCVCVFYSDLNASLNSKILCWLQRFINDVPAIQEVRTVLKRLRHLCSRLDSTEQVVMSSFAVELHNMLDLRSQSHVPMSCTEQRILVGVWLKCRQLMMCLNQIWWQSLSVTPAV